jgi:hypothetical protein
VSEESKKSLPKTLKKHVLKKEIKEFFTQEDELSRTTDEDDDDGEEILQAIEKGNKALLEQGEGTRKLIDAAVMETEHVRGRVEDLHVKHCEALITIQAQGARIEEMHAKIEGMALQMAAYERHVAATTDKINECLDETSNMIRGFVTMQAARHAAPEIAAPEIAAPALKKPSKFSTLAKTDASTLASPEKAATTRTTTPPQAAEPTTRSWFQPLGTPTPASREAQQADTEPKKKKFKLSRNE